MKKIIFSILLLLVTFTFCYKNKEVFLFGKQNEAVSKFVEKDELSTKKIREINIKNKEHIKQLRENDSEVVKNGFKKEYISKEKRVRILENKEKLLGASSGKFIDMKLISPYKQTVQEGTSTLVAEILLINWNNINTVFDLIDFYNDYEEIEKEFILKYSINTVEVDNCIPIDDNENFEEVCFKEDVTDWDSAIEFTNLSELPNKNINIGIYVKTIIKEKIEWVPSVLGFEVLEWASYDVSELDELIHAKGQAFHNSLVQIDSTHYILAYAGVDNDGFIKTFSVNSSSSNITQIDSIEHDTADSLYNSLVQIDSTHYILAYSGTGADGFIKTFSIDGSADNITQIDSIEHDTVQGTYNSLVQIDSTHYILAYSGSGSDGYIKTFSIDGSSDNITQIDSIEHDTVNGLYSSLAQIDSTHYILAYSGTDADGYIKTFSIDGSSDNITQIDSIEHDTADSLYNSITQIDSTHYILAYSGTDADGYIKTFSIDGSSDNITQIDSLEHDTVTGTYNSLVQIDSTHYMLTYAGNSSDGFIKTFSIDGSSDNITQIDSIEHDVDNGTYNSLVQIDSTHYMLAYSGGYLDGFIKTFSIDGSSDNITQIDSLIHDAGRATHNSITQIDSTHYILAYAGVDNDGFIKTFSIDGSSDNITQIDSIEHDVDNGTYNSLVQIDSTHYILAYSGTGADGYIKTFSIDGSSDNITQIDSLEHDTANGLHSSLVQIDSTHYILTYAGSGSDGYIKTFSIDGSSDNITQIDSLEHDTVNGLYNSIVQIDSTHYILAYSGNGADGYIKTFSIDGSSDNITQIDSIEHDTVQGTYNSLVQIDSTHYILTYAGSGSDGYIKTFSIDGSSDNITQIDSIEHDTVTGTYNSLVQIDSTHYILAYSGSGSDGYIKTFSIDGSSDNITQIDFIEHDTANSIYNSITQIDSTHYILAYVEALYASSFADGIIKTFYVEVPSAGPGTCFYSGSGDWNVLYSDNCYCTTTTYVLGDFNLVHDGVGSFNMQCELIIDDMNVGAGVDINVENSSSQINIY